MIARRSLLSVAASALFAGLAAGARAETAIAPLPLGVHVLVDEPAPEVDAWLDGQIAEANRLLSPHGLSVRRAWRTEHGKAAIDTPADRDALAKYLVDGAINVFLVARLRDIDHPARMRMGVRWRLRRDLDKGYVILSRSARKSVLCHELGHALGLPHSFALDNVMSYRRVHPEALAFDRAQGNAMRRAAQQLWARRRLLHPVKEAT